MRKEDWIRSLMGWAALRREYSGVSGLFVTRDVGREGVVIFRGRYEKFASRMLKRTYDRMLKSASSAI